MITETLWPAVALVAVTLAYHLVSRAIGCRQADEHDKLRKEIGTASDVARTHREYLQKLIVELQGKSDGLDTRVHDLSSWFGGVQQGVDQRVKALEARDAMPLGKQPPIMTNFPGRPPKGRS